MRVAGRRAHAGADEHADAARVRAVPAAAHGRAGSSEAPPDPARPGRPGSPALARLRRPVPTGPRTALERSRPAPTDSGRAASLLRLAAAPPHHDARTRPRNARRPTAWPSDARTRGAQPRVAPRRGRLRRRAVRATRPEARRPDPPPRFARPRYRPRNPADFSLITRSARRSRRKRSDLLWWSRCRTDVFRSSEDPGTFRGRARRDRAATIGGPSRRGVRPRPCRC